MKKRFNFISILILIALATAFIVNSSLAAEDFISGVHEGMQRTEKGHNQLEAHWINIAPTQEGENHFSLTSKDGKEQLSFVPRSVILEISKSEGQANNIFNAIIAFTTLATMITFILAIVFFIKFIWAVNKGIVFEKRNLHYLKVLGYSLLLSFVWITSYYLADYHFTKELFDVQGYKLEMTESIPFFWLIAGLTILLIRQFIAIGIKMKEEQDLTI